MTVDDKINWTLNQIGKMTVDNKINWTSNQIGKHQKVGEIMLLEKSGRKFKARSRKI